jgi:hypothetical protein
VIEKWQSHVTLPYSYARDATQEQLTFCIHGITLRAARKKYRTKKVRVYFYDETIHVTKNHCFALFALTANQGGPLALRLEPRTQQFNRPIDPIELRGVPE